MKIGYATFTKSERLLKIRIPVGNPSFSLLTFIQTEINGISVLSKAAGSSWSELGRAYSGIPNEVPLCEKTCQSRQLKALHFHKFIKNSKIGF